MPRASKRQPYNPALPKVWPEAERQNDPAVYSIRPGMSDNGARIETRETILHIRTVKGITADDERIAKRLAEAWEARERSPEQSGVYVDNTPDWSAIILAQTEAQTQWAKIWAAVPRWAAHPVAHVCVHNRALDRLPDPKGAGERIVAALRVMAKEGW